MPRLSHSDVADRILRQKELGFESAGLILNPYAARWLEHALRSAFSEGVLRVCMGYYLRRPSPRVCLCEKKTRAWMAPRIMYFNHERALLRPGHARAITDAMLRGNILRTVAMHRGWNVVFDTDESCANKTTALGMFSDRSLATARAWLARAPGKYRSDFCRLVQLYDTGGVYLDNDLEPVAPLDRFLRRDFVSVRAADGETIFQALIVAAPRHEVIRKSLVLFMAHMEDRLPVDDWVGPRIMARALQIATNSSRPLLLREVRLSPGDERMQGRRYSDACEFVVQESDRLVAYSRMLTFADSDDLKRECFASRRARGPTAHREWAAALAGAAVHLAHRARRRVR